MKDFPFNIVNFPFLCGNVPLGQSYGGFTSQVVIYGRGCMFVKDFVSRVQMLRKKLIRQSFTTKNLMNKFTHFWNKYPVLVQQYPLDYQQLSFRCFKSVDPA